MAIKEHNSVVGIEYELTEVDSIEVLDSNIGGQPLEIITGFKYIIPGLENGLIGMSEGESRDIIASPADAYGEYDPEQIHKYPKDHFEGVELEVGMTLYGRGEYGQTVEVKVLSFDDKEVEIDGNHPLAGKELKFAVTILSERDATEEEIDSGTIGGFCNTGG
jgi:FKBP-type peptidyl-prolyl cis-trans isomerase SlyD